MNTDHPILEYEQRLVAAQLSSNVAELDRLLADDLIYTGFSGETGGKSDDLELHRSGTFRITRMHMLEREIRGLADDVVVVVVLMDAEAVANQTTMTNHLRYTRVWARRGEEWQVAVAHLGLVQT